jgi:hypothetical protein
MTILQPVPLKRRAFLEWAGKSFLATAVTTALPGCGTVTRSGLSEASERQSLGNMLDEDRVEMLYLASLAPSGHNTQPWEVRIEEPNRWTLRSAKERWLPAVDPGNRELLLSLGAFLENMVVAGLQFGIAIDYQVIAKSPYEPDILELRLRRQPPVPSDLNAMRLRRTLRTGYQQRELRTEDVRFLTQSSNDSLYVPAGTPHATYLAQGTLEANRTQANRDAAQEELADWIRWSNKAARNHRTGLTPASMEIEGFAGWYVRSFFDRDSVLGESFRGKTVDMVAAQVKQCAGWILITSENVDVASLIETGRRFERLFLRVREKNIALHPMTQMLEEEPWRKEASKHLADGREIQFILRAGYRDRYPDPVSLRMPLARFVKPA